MHVVVVGCGRVGAGLAATLEHQGHSVAVIDKQPTAFQRLPHSFRGRRIVGVGFDRDRLREAGIEQADALAAVTNGDNSNIVVARIGREAFGVPRVVARIYDARRAVIYERLGVPTVATVEWSTERVLRRILPDAPGMEWIDPSARICLVERPLPSAWAGQPATALEELGTCRLVGLTRLGEARLPEDDLLLQEGDVAWLATRSDAVELVDRRLAAGPGRGVR